MGCEGRVARMDRCDMHTKFYSENLKERIFFEVQTIIREGNVKTCRKFYGEKKNWIKYKAGLPNRGLGFVR
jgi:hypothetical protein